MSVAHESFGVKVELKTGKKNGSSKLKSDLNPAFVRAWTEKTGESEELRLLYIGKSDSEIEAATRSVIGGTAPSAQPAEVMAAAASWSPFGCCSFSKGVAVLVAEVAGDHRKPAPHLLI